MKNEDDENDYVDSVPLKGHCHEIFYSGFFTKQLILVLIDTLERISNFTNIREVIRVRTRLPGVFITGKSITNMNNSTNIRKNLKSFLGMPVRTMKSCLMKNLRRKIS